MPDRISLPFGGARSTTPRSFAFRLIASRSLASLALLFGVGLAGCSGRTAAVAAEGTSAPREFVAVDHSFRVVFPTSAIDPIARAPATTEEEYGASARVERGDVVDEYEATYTDVADLDQVQAIDPLLDGLAQQGSIRFDARRHVVSGSLQGGEIDTRASDHIERWRYFKIGNRLFTIGVVTTAREYPSASKAFLESFQLVGAVPRRTRGLPGGMDVRLPNAQWKVADERADEEGCTLKIFARGDPEAQTPIPLFLVCALALPPGVGLEAFQAFKAGRDHYVRDAPFAHDKGWPLRFHDAVGFRAHLVEPAPKRVLVFYVVRNQIGFTLAIEAPEDSFAALEPEYLTLLSSLRPPAEAPPPALPGDERP